MKNFIKKIRTWYDKWLQPRRSPSKIFVGEISRALSELNKHQGGSFKCEIEKDEVKITITYSAVGQWVEGDYGETLKLMCSVCGSSVEYRTDFCPDCGAKMEEQNATLARKQSKTARLRS